jgi:hypothetical protein
LVPTDMILREGLPCTENDALFFLCERYNICQDHARKRYRMFLDKRRS